MRRLSNIANKILVFIDKTQFGYSNNKELARVFKRKPSTITEIIQTLMTKGFIERKKVGLFTEYCITFGAKAYLSQQRRVEETPNSINTIEPIIRLHALAIKVKYINPLSQEELIELAKPYQDKEIHLKGHTDHIISFKNHIIKLTQGGVRRTGSVIAYAQQAIKPLSSPIEALHKEALANTLRIISALETQFNAKNRYFKLRKHMGLNGELVYDYRIIEEHIAITNDEFAKEAVKITKPYIISRSDSDKKVTLLADESIKLAGYRAGIAEVEGYHTGTAKEDAAPFVVERVRKLYESVGKGWYDYEEERKARLETMKLINEIKGELAVHRQAYTDLSKVSKKILEYFNQRKLFEVRE